MDEKQAVASLAALAHPQRLRIFRRLIEEGASGLPAFAIAEAVEATPTAASFHLKELERAGLIHATRHGRFVRYAVLIDGMRGLLTYLTEDCCQGRPELCGASVDNPRRLCTPAGAEPTATSPTGGNGLVRKSRRAKQKEGAR